MIETPRLTLVRATTAHLQGELAGRDAFLKALGRDVAAGWPPEFYDSAAVTYALNWLTQHPEEEGWWFSYIVRRPVEGQPEIVIGASGFKGPPDADGVVEIGYGIVPEYQRMGYATEAVRGMVEYAFRSPGVRLVCAHTYPRLIASIGVLEKAGFRYAGEGHDPHADDGEVVVRYECPRDP